MFWWGSYASARIPLPRSGSPPRSRTARRRVCALAARARLGADVAAGATEAARRATRALGAARGVLATRPTTVGDATLMRRTARHRRAATIPRPSDAGMAGARATAAILAGLPARGGARPTDRCRAVELPAVRAGGGWLLVVGVTLVCSGLLWSDRITVGVLT